MDEPQSLYERKSILIKADVMNVGKRDIWVINVLKMHSVAVFRPRRNERGRIMIRIRQLVTDIRRAGVQRRENRTLRPHPHLRRTRNPLVQPLTTRYSIFYQKLKSYDLLLFKCKKNIHSLLSACTWRWRRISSEGRQRRLYYVDSKSCTEEKANCQELLLQWWGGSGGLIVRKRYIYLDIDREVNVSASRTYFYST